MSLQSVQVLCHRHGLYGGCKTNMGTYSTDIIMTSCPSKNIRYPTKNLKITTTDFAPLNAGAFPCRQLDVSTVGFV